MTRAFNSRPRLHWTKTLVILGVIGVWTKVAAQVPPGSDAVATVFSRAVDHNDGYGAGLFTVLHGTTPILVLEQGTRSEGGSAAAESADLFDIASISKTFTAVTALLLVENGTLSLDAPISTYLEESAIAGLLVWEGMDYTPTLTIRQLLTHTSGLPDYWNDPPFIKDDFNLFVARYVADPDAFWSPREVLAEVPALWPIALPGTSWHYADTGYVIVGLIIEQATGLPLHEVYRTHIFEPLGMTDTYLPIYEAPPSFREQCSRYEGRWLMTGRRHQSADWAGGGLVSSISDLAIFARAALGRGLFSSPDSESALRDVIATGEHDVTYGLGVFQLHLDDGLGDLWGHDGYGNSFMYYWPERDITFVGTLNQHENDWWPMVEEAIIWLE